MTENKTKKFWSSVSVAEAEAGYEVLLDNRTIKTPAKRPLMVPTADLATAIASEWETIVDVVDPEVMPLTRSANAAIDKVQDQFPAVAEMIAAYGDSDLICYRADGPDGLVARQAAAWDPLIEWSESTLGAKLKPVTGIMHSGQNPNSLAVLEQEVSSMSHWGLTALHDLVALSGSLIIGLAATKGWENPQALWDRSRVDEQWQIDAWGEDDDANITAEIKRQAFLSANRFYQLSCNQS